MENVFLRHAPDSVFDVLAFWMYCCIAVLPCEAVEPVGVLANSQNSRTQYRMSHGNAV